MVRPKGAPKKPQKRGIDFKKYKRKVGRKLPPPKNSTNTEIKSKAIILPEQSVASEKAGLAVNKKGLTLKELLQQTAHHNSKVRKDALLGIRDLFLRNPSELKLHRVAVIEKLRERISDDDKAVRETLYQLLKSVVFPGCKEDNQGPFITLMLAYIFNAMTHLAIDIRLMAFNFFDLVVHYHPPSFFTHAEKILQNFENILRNNQFYLQDKGKLRNALACLVHCLSLLPCKKKEAALCEEVVEKRLLHGYEPDSRTESTGFPLIIQKLKDLVAVLVDCFQDFIPLVRSMPVLDAQSFQCMLSILQSIDLAVSFYVSCIRKSKVNNGEPDAASWDQTIFSVLMQKLLVVFPLNSTSLKDGAKYFGLNVLITEIFMNLTEFTLPQPDILVKFLAFMEDALCEKIPAAKSLQERNLISLLPFIPRLVFQVDMDWRSRLLQALMQIFKECSPESSLKLACLSSIKKILIPGEGMLLEYASDPLILDSQITWIRELPKLLVHLGDKHPSSSQAVLRLQLKLGQFSALNSFLESEFSQMQFSLEDFYSTCHEGNTCYGPFIRLPRECQELAVCCLYYFSFLDPVFLKSIASCCLSDDLDSSVIFRILEVVESAYKIGHIQIADYISFFITLLSCFKISYEANTHVSNFGTFKSMTSFIGSCLSQMGDKALVLRMLENIIINQILLDPPLDNTCAMLRMLVILDSSPTTLSHSSITALGSFLPGYLLNVVMKYPEHHNKSTNSTQTRSRRHYYIPPCFFLFERSPKLLSLALSSIGLFIAESSAPPHPCSVADRASRIEAIVSLLLFMHKDARTWRLVSSMKPEINSLSQNLHQLQASGEGGNMTLEDRHKVVSALDRLKVLGL